MPHAAQVLPPTAVEDDVIAFRIADPEQLFGGVRLWCDLTLPDTTFERVAGGWELRLPLPAVDRVEYLLEVTRADATESWLDPGNPLRVGGAFGDHSWLALPGYREPDWLLVAPVPHERTAITIGGTPVGDIDVSLWAPADAGADEDLPLLISHDGPEMDELGGLTHFVGAMIATGRLPRMRVALLAPGERNPRYAANPAYADALCHHVVPGLAVLSARRPVLMGQSLGALAALHAEWTHPGTFAGLVLQSGSFFTPELDPQESGFEFWDQVSGFVSSVLTAAAPSTPPVSVVFGSAEENAGNNRLVERRLAELGLDVVRGEVRDGHTWTCWRDLLDPHLPDLLAKAWG